MKKYLYIIILTVISSTAISIIFINNEKKGIDYWEKNIRLCQNKNLKTEREVFDYSYGCLKNSIRSAVFSDDFNSWYLAAEPIMANDIRLEYVCHIPGHDLGGEFNEYFKNDYKKAIMALGYDICGGGIVHGIFDIWGKEKHSVGEWLRISEACIEQNLIRYSTCGDAIGHAAYESVGNNLSEAINICDMLQQDWIRNSCANGSFMQKYFPQSSELKLIRKETIPNWDSLITFCDRIDFKQSGTADGCYGGAGWVIGNDIFFKSQKYSNNINNFKASNEGFTNTIDLILKAFNSCIKNYNLKSNKGDPSVCINLVLNRLPLFWYMDSEQFIKNCEKVSNIIGIIEFNYEDYDFFSNCIAGGYEHINRPKMSLLFEKFPKVNEIVRSRNPNLAGLVKNI